MFYTSINTVYYVNNTCSLHRRNAYYREIRKHRGAGTERTRPSSHRPEGTAVSLSGCILDTLAPGLGYSVSWSPCRLVFMPLLGRSSRECHVLGVSPPPMPSPASASSLTAPASGSRLTLQPQPSPSFFGHRPPRVSTGCSPSGRCSLPDARPRPRVLSSVAHGRDSACRLPSGNHSIQGSSGDAELCHREKADSRSRKGTGTEGAVNDLHRI